MSMVTIVQVAEHAGVSIATVSRVINGNEKVKPEIAARVQEAIKTLNYVPSVSARNMKGKRNLHIGFIVPRLDDDFFSKMLNSVTKSAAEHDAIVTVFSSNGDAGQERKSLRSAVIAGVSALLFCPASYISPEEFYEIVPRDFPVIIVYRRDIIPDVPHIYHDNVHGAEDATKYLLRLGRRKIAFFAGFWGHQYTAEETLELYKDEVKRGAYSTLDRLHGYIHVLNEAGIPLDPGLIVPCGLNHASGYEQAKKFLASLRDFDSIICGKDEVAAGILLALNEQKISVPEEVSIVSFDDSAYAIMTRPMLTTVKQSPDMLGVQAVEMCIEMLQGRPVHDRVIEMELKIRNSTSGKA